MFSGRVKSTTLSSSNSIGGRVLQVLAAQSHFVLALMVVGVVGMVILPVPPLVLDVLIAFNIAVSVLLLMLALYIPTSLAISTFPSLIVLTTALRLSLNIASTKQILLNAHAGQIIETFGRLVIGGSVIVGLVIFVVIAVVQFVVISKGAERVAEVGARFTLDALPGKQMAIEADLRAGHIDKQEARRLRQLLEQESTLNGALDGAMKFVKGDAIAAILIALVNIIGGISIGIWMMGLSVDDAMARFTLLSVGDGMVSQIPSLLTSIAAGLLITRAVGQEGQPLNMAAQVGKQIAAQPLALLAAGAVMCAFLLVPGFPKIPFALLATAFIVMGLRSMKGRRGTAPGFGLTPSLERDGVQPAQATSFSDDPLIVAPLRLYMSTQLKAGLLPSVLQSALEREASDLQRDLGLTFPPLQVRFDQTLPGNVYEVHVQEVPIFRGELTQGKDAGVRGAAENELGRQVGIVVRSRPDAFVGTQEINTLVKRAQQELPDLHEEVMRTMPMQRVAEVLRRLALEGVSLRYLREIYESLLTWAPREKDTALLCERVRAELGRFICHRFIGEGRSLRAILLDAAAEAQVRGSLQQGPSGVYLALPPEALRGLLASAESAIAAIPDEGAPTVLLATMETRRFLRRALVDRFPRLSVLSYAELPADVKIQAIARLSLPKLAPLRVKGTE